MKIIRRFIVAGTLIFLALGISPLYFPATPKFVSLLSGIMILIGLFALAFTKPPDYVCKNCGQKHWRPYGQYRPLKNGRMNCKKCGAIIYHKDADS